MKQLSIGSAYNFQPCQIVCLEHEDTRLYAEMIDFVASRQNCWVRPLLLALPVTDSNPLSIESTTQLKLCDLRFGADLLWPASLFRPALDTEVIPLLVELSHSDTQTENNLNDHKQLNRFIREVWQAYKTVF